MKKLLLLLCMVLLACGSADAQKGKFYPAIIVQQDGTQIECLAQYPDNFFSKDIKYRADKNSKALKMKSDDIDKIRYFLENDKVVDLERLATINSVNLSNGIQKYEKPQWLNVAIQGAVTLYYSSISFSDKRGATTYHYYYCKRENEKYASMMVLVNYNSKKDPFFKVAPEYFADSPSISEKIKNKEKGYLQEDIEAIVKEYNAEKLAQNGK